MNLEHDGKSMLWYSYVSDWNNPKPSLHDLTPERLSAGPALTKALLPGPGSAKRLTSRTPAGDTRSAGLRFIELDRKPEAAEEILPQVAGAPRIHVACDAPAPS